MKKYVTLLRGINVGGHKKVLKKDLHTLFLKLGFAEIHTIAQTGNIIFKSDTKNSTDEISEIIKTAIQKRYGFEVHTQTRTEDEFLEIFKKNPFEKFDEKKLYITFLNQTTTTKINADEFLPDRFVVQSHAIFTLYDNKISDSKLTNNVFEKKLNVSATTRNWKTCQKIKALIIE